MSVSLRTTPVRALDLLLITEVTKKMAVPLKGLCVGEIVRVLACPLGW